jgi:hypothetical protein
VRPDEPTTQELRLQQLERERAEKDAADTAPTDAAQQAAERRADKAAYLRAKLEEQQAADEHAPGTG